MQGDKRYHPHAGSGWEEITDPELVNFNVLTVRGVDVYQKLDIKFVVVYNNSLIFNKEITLYKKYNNRFAITQTESAEGTFLNLLDAKNKVKEVYWYSLLEDGTYSLCND
jgi:hypothetical protein